MWFDYLFYTPRLCKSFPSKLEFKKPCQCTLEAEAGRSWFQVSLVPRASKRSLKKHTEIKQTERSPLGLPLSRELMLMTMFSGPLTGRYFSNIYCGPLWLFGLAWFGFSSVSQWEKEGDQVVLDGKEMELRKAKSFTSRILLGWIMVCLKDNAHILSVQLEFSSEFPSVKLKGNLASFLQGPTFSQCWLLVGPWVTRWLAELLP